MCNHLNKSTSFVFTSIKSLYFYLEPANFASAFGSGYLLGELMNKYGLQEDFNSFSPGK